MNILEEIIAHKHKEIAIQKQQTPLSKLEGKLEGLPQRPDFVKALRAAPIGLIAEVKRRSPSAGAIREPFDPAEIALAYQTHGAHAVSCLMDQKYFGGGIDDFRAVRAAIDLPMLYKEFVIDPWQLIHAKANGASAVLLIVGALSDQELTNFIQQITALKMDALVEVHDQEEMVRAIDAGASCIGINNRNLKTFHTTLETTFELMDLAPAHSTLVSESGIKTPEEVRALKDAGIHAILVGETLLREPSPGIAAQSLLSCV